MNATLSTTALQIARMFGAILPAMNDNQSTLNVPLDTGSPSIHPLAWTAPGAVLCGPVTVGSESSIWYGAVLRADCAEISIGARTSIQDNCVLHAGFDRPITIGDDVSVGHGAIIHGSSVADRVLVGMGATLLNGCQIESDVIVAAGSLLTERFVAPAGSLVMGSPARVVRSLAKGERERIVTDATVYLELLRRHRDGGLT